MSPCRTQGLRLERRPLQWQLPPVPTRILGPAMSGPGPSGARPEHLRELIAVRDRRCSGAMLAAIGKLVEVATAGKLCEAARWILDSRLVFLAKKAGAAPRPIRVGEF